MCQVFPETRAVYNQITLEDPDFSLGFLNSFLEVLVIETCFTCGSDQPMEILQCKKCGKGLPINSTSDDKEGHPIGVGYVGSLRPQAALYPAPDT